MKRKEIYEFIRENELAEEIAKEFSCNYTHVKNADLEKFISCFVKKQTEKVACDAIKNAKENKKKIEKNLNKINKETVKDCCKNINVKDHSQWIAKKFNTLVTLLKEKNLLNKEELKKILDK